MAQIKYTLTKVNNGAVYTASVVLSCGHEVKSGAAEFSEESALAKCEQNITREINNHVKNCK